MKKPLDFNVASNPHDALLQQGSLLAAFFSFAWRLAALSSAVILPQAVRGEGHAVEIKTRDGMLNQHQLVI